MCGEYLVSVIVPNYNHARFLDERIQSILNQTYQNFELIFLDDKSTDNSLDIINKYKNDPHVSHIVINEENSGSPFKQWNKGFKLAKGELIWIAESDDSCSPFFLEKMISMHHRESAVLSFCRSQKLDEKGRLLTTWQNILKQDVVWDGKEFIEKYLGIFNIVVNASSVIFNRDLLSEVSDVYYTFRGAGDWLLWIELSRKGKVAFCSESLNHFRFHDTNTTAKCYSSGANYIEGKMINDYLFSESLISHKIYKTNIYNNIFKIQESMFDSEATKREVLHLWGYNYSFKLKSFLSAFFHKLLSLMWRY